MNPVFAEQPARAFRQAAKVLRPEHTQVSLVSAAQLIAQSHSTRLMVQKLRRSGVNLELQPPVEVRTTVWYNPDLISAYFMIPGVIGMILYAIAAILTATSVVRERERGTIEQLIVTPIRSWELIVGKLMPYVILGFFNTIEVLAVGHWWFGMPIRGDLTLILVLSVVFLATGLGIGLFSSTIANTQQEAMLTVWMTLLPSIFLSGFFFPLEAMPKVGMGASTPRPRKLSVDSARIAPARPMVACTSTGCKMLGSRWRSRN